jgi:hypothetical protein
MVIARRCNQNPTAEPKSAAMRPSAASDQWCLARLDDGWRWIRAEGTWIELHELPDGTARVADSTGRVASFDCFAAAHAESWRRRSEL